MDALERMNLAMAYIEENLSGEVDMQHMEQLALCSEYHFRRMFSFLAGVPLSEYVRRRRLMLAAFELLLGEVTVLETAVKFGHSSPDAFARAFTALHGVTPSEARNDLLRIVGRFSTWPLIVHIQDRIYIRQQLHFCS